MAETTLEKFIREKLDNYVEPQREGTPKGEPIGLSLVKYKASLLLMASRKQKEIAEEVGVSYGLLRKWKTEQDFIKIVDEHVNEFSELRIKLLSEEEEKDLKKFKESLNKSAEEMLASLLTETSILRSYDAEINQYGTKLLKTIEEKLSKKVELQKKVTLFDFPFPSPMTVFLDHIRGVQSEASSVDSLRKAIDNITSYIEKCLLKPRLTETDKKLALMHLFMLAGLAEYIVWLLERAKR